MKNPKVSVLMATHNPKESHLRESIESILIKPTRTYPIKKISEATKMTSKNVYLQIKESSLNV